MCNSGAEAVEGAVKLAYKYHGGRRGHILHADNSFHGKLLGSSGLTAFSEQPFKFPTIPGIDTFAYDTIESVEAKVRAARERPSDIYAIILEHYCVNAIARRSVAF
jgi:putrescine aminotransferase